MLARTFVFALLGAASVCLAACGDAGPREDDNAGADAFTTIDTKKRGPREQYEANVSFLADYKPVCANPKSGRPRVLVTGFGRFLDITENAAGRMVSTLVPGSVYPVTAPPKDGEVDPPAPQVNVTQATITLPQSGLVDVCAMILPVSWDLAALLIAKEADAFQPSFVMMNGIAAPRQAIWIELGSTNRAAAGNDGSRQMRPAVGRREEHTTIVAGGADTQPNLLSWRAVEAGARASIEAHAEDVDGGTKFSTILPGVLIAGFPRATSTYVCNNVSYATGYLMAHPGEAVELLKAKPAVKDRVNEVVFTMQSDLREVPRVFMHWPAELATKHRAAGAAVMAAILDAQLVAIARGDKPTAGDNQLADPSQKGGAYY